MEHSPKEFYKRKLPHYQPLYHTYFVTFRLNGSIPKSTLNDLQDEYLSKIDFAKKADNETIKYEMLAEIRFNYLIEMDNKLEQLQYGPHFLTHKEVASEVALSIKKHDSIYYNLICYTIMSNHVHLLLDTSIQKENLEKQRFLKPKYLDEIMKLIKGSSANASNKILNRSGQFWERESYDTIIYSDTYFNNAQAYILNNPVKANIVDSWDKYEFTYHKNQ